VLNFNYLPIKKSRLWWTKKFFMFSKLFRTFSETLFDIKFLRPYLIKNEYFQKKLSLRVAICSSRCKTVMIRVFGNQNIFDIFCSTALHSTAKLWPEDIRIKKENSKNYQVEPAKNATTKYKRVCNKFTKSEVIIIFYPPLSINCIMRMEKYVVYLGRNPLELALTQHIL